MILKSPTSKLSIVNLLADYILNKIPKEEESIIQVVDCMNFYVIKGKTTYKETLDIAKIKDEFTSKFKEQLVDLKLTHTIDLIDYNSKLEDNNLIFCSEFPHGYSLKQGRLMYYYGKHIFYNIPYNYPFSTLTFTMSTSKDESGDNQFSVKNSHQKEDETLKSAILDVFDFDMSWLDAEMKKVDWSIELTNPLQEYDFLKKKVKDFVIF